MTALWQPLRDELKRCRAEGLPLPLWWRDDDAVRPGAALDKLFGIAERNGMAVHLAVIPAHAEPSLGDYIRHRPALIPVVHGWAHENHAPTGAKKAEFGHPRSGGAEEIAEAHQRLSALFGTRLLPVFVPPWNRFDAVFLDALTAAGYCGISTFLARKDPHPAPGLRRTNAHVDPVDWRGTRGLKDPAVLVADTVARLRARRQGSEDPMEPLGLLTHHLVHGADVWHFAETFLNEMQDGGARPACPFTYPETTR